MDVLEALADLADPPGELLVVARNALLQGASLEHLHFDAEDVVIRKVGAEVGDYSWMVASAQDCCLVDEVAHINEGGVEEGLYSFEKYLLYREGFSFRAALTDLSDGFFLSDGNIRGGHGFALQYSMILKIDRSLFESK